VLNRGPNAESRVDLHVERSANTPLDILAGNVPIHLRVRLVVIGHAEARCGREHEMPSRFAQIQGEGNRYRDIGADPVIAVVVVVWMVDLVPTRRHATNPRYSKQRAGPIQSQHLQYS